MGGDEALRNAFQRKKADSRLGARPFPAAERPHGRRLFCQMIPFARSLARSARTASNPPVVYTM
jgi:hypothetical protein